MVDEQTNSILQTTQEQVREQAVKGLFHPASAVDENLEEIHQLIEVVTKHEKFLNVLKQELRGEQLFQEESGERYWVQTEKPMFIKVDKLNRPLKYINSKTRKEEYICNDDAINEIINIVKLCGFNPIAPMTEIDEEEIRADLLEMESKITVLLFNNRKRWGIAKSDYPVYIGKLKVLLKDARYMAKGGRVLKALRTMTNRIEQSAESNRNKSIGERIQSPFK